MPKIINETMISFLVFPSYTQDLRRTSGTPNQASTYAVPSRIQHNEARPIPSLTSAPINISRAIPAVSPIPGDFPPLLT